ncbi:hypothetical protein UFOVP700_15 [uncultured Caudovirales phage]|uniref:Uncharacterized protein n=1 Tax=uncultured Caudovirales phage TaxID=2100421 RepID=A0A6J5NFM2_9CAUD|nr:hypothetical protein UFOVP700_15 [uncultured Caudovirales phage]
MSQEKNNLETHVELCTLRYEQLDQRIQRVEQQLDRVCQDIQEFRTTINSEFNEIKTAIAQSKDERFRVSITTAGTIIVALIGLIGYITLGLR